MALPNNKYGHKNSFRASLTFTMTATLECNLCGKSFSEEVEDETEEGVEVLKDQLAEKAYKEGWRYTQSKVQGIQGIFCKECNANKDNPDYLNY
jgi:hypothetical protein